MPGGIRQVSVRAFTGNTAQVRVPQVNSLPSRKRLSTRSHPPDFKYPWLYLDSSRRLSMKRFEAHGRAPAIMPAPGSSKVDPYLVHLTEPANM